MACIFFLLAVLILRASAPVPSPNQIYIGREDGDFERCVCRPRVILNPPVCRRSDQIDSGANCSSAVHQEKVSSELRDVRHQLYKLQRAVSSQGRNTTHQLEDARRQTRELKEVVEKNLGDMKHQLEQLQVEVLAIVRILLNSVPKDCSEVLERGMTESGVYKIQPKDSGWPIHVYCDMETDGGGWTVFQRRQDGSVDFYRNFANYSRGFGDLEGEFWLGNDNLHRLTAQGEYELRLDLSDFENESRYAVYDSFSIADVSDNYRLTLGNYSGTAGDSLSYHNNSAFTTKDMDNDGDPANFAVRHHGAWWYNVTNEANLNGKYLTDEGSKQQGIIWYHWKNSYSSLKYTDMKIRVKS